MVSSKFSEENSRLVVLTWKTWVLSVKEGNDIKALKWVHLLFWNINEMQSGSGGVINGTYYAWTPWEKRIEQYGWKTHPRPGYSRPWARDAGQQVRVSRPLCGVFVGVPWFNYESGLARLFIRYESWGLMLPNPDDYEGAGWKRLMRPSKGECLTELCPYFPSSSKKKRACIFTDHNASHQWSLSSRDSRIANKDDRDWWEQCKIRSIPTRRVIVSSLLVGCG